MQELLDPSSEEASPGFRKPRRPRAPAPTVASIDRLPPHSIEAEQGVLGSILLSPNDSLGLCVEKLRRGTQCFYDLRHQTLYDKLQEMYDGREPIDIITVQQKLKDAHQLDAIGGVAYLTALVDATPSPAKYIAPRLNSASGNPAFAAFRYQLTASFMSLVTPRPAA